MIFTTSWDDGYFSDLRIAELLTAYHAKGTFYVCPQAQHNQPMLNKAQILELSRTHEIGAHTIHHPKLSRIPISEAKAEIQESKKWVEEITKTTCTMFCYPYGDYNQSVAMAVQEAGYTSARTVEKFQCSSKEPFELGTTLHVYPYPWRPKFSKIVHYIDMLGPLRFHWKTLQEYNVPLRKRGKWIDMAKALFDQAYKENKPFFHVWGHAYELDRYNLWGRLEELLKHISSYPDIEHKTNGELAATLFDT